MYVCTYIMAFFYFCRAIYDAQNSIAFYSYSSKISCLQIHICTYICMYIAQQRNI